MHRQALLAAALLLGVHGAAYAESCLEAIDRLASEHGLTTTIPEKPGENADAGTLSEKLSETGGVLAPPEGGRTVVIDPPETGEDGMPTAPEVTPDPPSSETAKPPELNPADRQQAESLLSAARAEAERGDREQCFERLQEAQGILRRSNG